MGASPVGPGAAETDGAIAADGSAVSAGAAEGESQAGGTGAAAWLKCHAPASRAAASSSAPAYHAAPRRRGRRESVRFRPAMAPRSFAMLDLTPLYSSAARPSRMGVRLIQSQPQGFMQMFYAKTDDAPVCGHHSRDG